MVQGKLQPDSIEAGLQDEPGEVTTAWGEWGQEPPFTELQTRPFSYLQTDLILSNYYTHLVDEETEAQWRWGSNPSLQLLSLLPVLALGFWERGWKEKLEREVDPAEGSEGGERGWWRWEAGVLDLEQYLF